MSKTIGQAIYESRKRQGVKAAVVAAAVGISAPAFSKIENDQLQGGPSSEIVVKIANFLSDRSILTTYLQNDLVYQAILPKVFSDLNCIKEDPAIVLTSFVGEAEESIEAAKILIQMFRNADPTRTPNYREVLMAKMEQLTDVIRNGEIVFEKMIKFGALTEEDRILIYDRQQKKCEEKGHHIPEVAA